MWHVVDLLSMYSLHIISIKVVIGKNECIMYKFSIHTFMTFESIFLINAKFPNATKNYRYSR